MDKQVCGGVFFFNDRCGRLSLTMDSAMGQEVVQGVMKKQAEQSGGDKRL